MSPSREQWRAAESPETSAIELAQLAQIPKLQLAIAGNPAASDELLDWLAENGSAEVRAILDPNEEGAPVATEADAAETDEQSDDEVPWELQDESSEATVPAATEALPRIARPSRQHHDWDDLWLQEQEYRRKRLLSKEEREAEHDRAEAKRLFEQEQADLAARAAEIQRWEAAYALAHNGEKPPPGYAPPIQFAGTDSRDSRTNGMAIAALILAIVGASVLALIFGYVARGQIQRTNEQGSGFALAAIVLGWIGVIVGAVILIWYLVLLSQVSAAFQSFGG